MHSWITVNQMVIFLLTCTEFLELHRNVASDVAGIICFRANCIHCEVDSIANKVAEVTFTIKQGRETLS